MSGPFRLAQGGLVDRAKPLGFRFDGKNFAGYEGDTLASALLGAGVRLVGRSFKYHRPRGIVTAGAEEPSALVDLIGARGREPNIPATMLELAEGLLTESQNHWPSLSFDAMAINGLFSRFLAAGFYYKTFMGPASFWEKVYEPAIRRAAGLGRLEPVEGHGNHPDIVHAHTDVLVVGAGAAGLSAARALAECGARVILAERMPQAGGGTLLDPAWDDWRAQRLADLFRAENCRVMTRTSVIGAYGHGVFALVERHVGQEGPSETLHVVRARRVVLATGATERLVAFPGNDRPGVMLAGAALAYLKLYGVAVGARVALLAANDEAYRAIFALREAGVAIAAVVDPRPDSPAQQRARDLSIAVHAGSEIVGVSGGKAVTGVRIAPLAIGRSQSIDCDTVLMSGGFSPATALATQAGGTTVWDERAIGFVADLPDGVGEAAGAAAGQHGLIEAARGGHRAVARMATALGFDPVPALRDLPDVRDEGSFATPLWRSSATNKAFVDLQNDVTVEDIRLAHREGFEHVEHAKRYTTHGMGTDQGKIGGLVGSAILAEARGVPIAATGLPTPRPFVTPVPWEALAGPETGAHMKPKRRLPLHDWHERAGATFALTGLWLRPLVYSSQSGWDPVLAEARAVRQRVGMTDVSSLGKIDVQGRDAARFLDFIYANTFSTLPVGRCRYGIMLREDGMMFDDGTTSRLGEAHYLVTTTTANNQAVLEHLEFHKQTLEPGLDVHIADVTDQWAQFAIAGPRAHAVLARVVAGLDLSNEAFPFMAAGAATIAGVPGRLFRISFSGELAYEVAVPASEAEAVWTAILKAGEPEGLIPYGLDALNSLRIEKGHVTGAELNGNTTADDLGFGKMAKKSGDFVGRVLRNRPGLLDPARQKLVGLRPLNKAQRLRNGAHLVDPADPTASLGFITSSTPSVELEGWVGLALLSGGMARRGERLLALSPVTKERVEVEIVSPHFVDPQNIRVKSIDPAAEAVAAAPSLRWGGPALHLVEIAEATGLPRMGRMALSEGILRMRLRPDAILQISAEAPDGDSGVMVDRSSALAGFIVSGPAAREALARLCRLDLHPRVFKPGDAASTFMAQVSVTIALLDARPTFLLLTPATTARHFGEALAHAAERFGMAVGVEPLTPTILSGELIDED